MTPAPPAWVVDASVAVQLVVPEPLSAQATQLFALLHGGRALLHVPDLFYIECANAFWKKVGRGACTPAQAAQALADLAALPLRSTPRFALAAYDACQVALAQRLGVPLITADQPLEQKFAGPGVIWTGRWTPPPAPAP